MAHDKSIIKNTFSIVRNKKYVQKEEEEEKEKETIQQHTLTSQQPSVYHHDVQHWSILSILPLLRVKTEQKRIKSQEKAGK